jgi:hypothetical protein
MAGLKLPEGPAEILGDKISRAGVIAADGKRLETMGLVCMEYARETVSTELATVRAAFAALVEMVDQAVLVKGEAGVASWPHRPLRRDEIEIIQAARSAVREPPRVEAAG